MIKTDFEKVIGSEAAKKLGEYNMSNVKDVCCEICGRDIVEAGEHDRTYEIISNPPFTCYACGTKWELYFCADCAEFIGLKKAAEELIVTDEPMTKIMKCNRLKDAHRRAVELFWRTRLVSLVCDIFGALVEWCADEGSAAYPRAEFGKRLKDLGIDIPLTEDERYELKFESKYNYYGKTMHEVCEELGIEVDE